MAWDDENSERDLKTALALFDWPRAEDLCRLLIQRIRREEAPLSTARALSTLGLLRGAKRFDTLARVADALLQSGVRAGGVIVPYAQTLIECGYLEAAERLLDAPCTDADDAETQGLKGRILKDRYIKAGPGAAARYKAYLSRSIDAYLGAYRVNPARNYWHGINVVALLSRAQRDGVVRADGWPDAQDVAKQVLASVTPATPGPWELATALEASLVLGNLNEAERFAREFAAHPDTTAFQLGGTLRQLMEVYQLEEATAPGSRLLPLLQAALLRRPGGGLRVGTGQDGVARISPGPAPENGGTLERVFGADRFVTLKWYRDGLERCKSVARIESASEKAVGTGWLVECGALTGNGSKDLVLVTNAHVMSPQGVGGLLRPEQARARFQTGPELCRIDRVLWSFSAATYDVTVATLKALPPDAAPLPLSDATLTASGGANGASRLYIIGYPGGGDLQLSMHDNELLGFNERCVHYRTPTEHGSSGSPVFDDEEWTVVALHHSGKKNMARLDGSGEIYEANEGILIRAIRQGIASTPALP